MKTANTSTENRLQEATQRVGARFMPNSRCHNISVVTADCGHKPRTPPHKPRSDKQLGRAPSSRGKRRDRDLTQCSEKYL